MGNQLSVRFYCVLLLLLQLIVHSVSLSATSSHRRNPTYVNIGGIFSSMESTAFFRQTVSHLNSFNSDVVYDSTVTLMDVNPIRTALKVCNNVINQSVYAVVVSHSFNGDLSPAAVSHTSGFFHIPVIGISSRDSAFSDKNIHVSFLRTVPPYSHQADVWIKLLKDFSFRKVILIHSSDKDGRALMRRFQLISESLEEDSELKVQVDIVIEFEPGMESFTEQLQNIKNTTQSHIFLLYAKKNDAEVVFRDASALHLTDVSYVWIITEQALEADNAPIGVLGLRLINATSEKDHIKDSIYVLQSAFQQMNQTEVITTPPKDCGDSAHVWETGKLLFGFIKKQNLVNGSTGNVAFDDKGDRINAEYDVINVDSDLEQHIVGQYHYSNEHKQMKLTLDKDAIVWPGGVRHFNWGIPLATHLKVLTIEEKPFVYVRHAHDEECSSEEIPCTRFNSSDYVDTYCCRGYCMDLLKELARKINFTYQVGLSPDGQFGDYLVKESKDNPMGGKKEWTGLIGELVNERADMIVAPLTINPERAEFIEFSKPFKYQGITILEKKPLQSSTVVSFLQPFSNTLWILVMISVNVVALVLYLLDRFSPFQYLKMTNAQGKEENPLNFSSALWFAWSVLLNSGIGEGIPRSFCTRVLGMIWAGFAMIIFASYTANLAAFLVLGRPKTKLTGINDARLRNTMENLTYATVRGSAVDMYFQRQAELANMYRTMEANNYGTAEQAIQDVRNGKLMAFIWDSSRLEYEAAQDCELVTSGELFGHSGYGIGLTKGSRWADAVTIAILDFHESGVIDSLDRRWIFQGNLQNCDQFEKPQHTLGLKNMAGVFLLVAAGIVGGSGLIVIEMIYKKHEIRKQRTLRIVRRAANKWRGMVETKAEEQADDQQANFSLRQLDSMLMEHLNFNSQFVPKGVTYDSTAILMDPNPIRTALNVCNYLINQSVYAVVVSHPLTGDLSPAAVSYTSGFYHIPVIGISSRDSAFSDKNIHVSFLRTVPPYSHQADVWMEFLRHFNYLKVIFIHSSDTDGRALLGRFQSAAQNLDEDVETKVQVEFIIEFEPGLETFADVLMEVRHLQSRVYLMYAGKTDSEIIFRDAGLLNMTGLTYMWLVSEQALDASNVPVGTLGLKLVNATSEEAHIQDSIYVLASAIREMNQTEVITKAPKDCGDSGHIWETGKMLFDFIKKQNLINGSTGYVAFDDNGDRINAEYDIVNVQSNQTQISVGQYHYSMELKKMTLRMDESAIRWPGNSPIAPLGILIPTHLKVLTIEEKPFVYVREIQGDEGCTPEEIPCPHFNNTADSAAGGKKEWTGLIGELVYERADMIVAPLTINPERAEFIEFSKPFKYQGITILEKKPSRSSTLVSFLQPFSNTLWILVMVSVHVVALVLYLLDRFSPFGRYKPTNSDTTEEDALNLSSAIWFAWGVLLNSGIGEGTPRSFSARVLGMVWAGFAMIIVASYTANLAAFLVLERPKTKLSGINDARLRNTMENLTCATVKGSAVDMYFRRQVELSNMYRTMEANNYDNAEEAIRDVKKGKLMAFIWDSSRLEYEAAQDCELVTAGELFGRSGYGIGLKKGSPWADAVTLAILDFHESGVMESLDNRWILQGNPQLCEQFEKTPNTLGLKNMAGVFILVAAGIVGGVVLIMIEMAYKRHQIRKQKRMDLARHAADKWRGAIQKRKTLRATIAAQRRLKTGGIGDPSTVSLSVDTLPRQCMETRSPARAWPGGCDVRQRAPHAEDSSISYGTVLPDMIV